MARANSHLNGAWELGLKEIREEKRLKGSCLLKIKARKRKRNHPTFPLLFSFENKTKEKESKPFTFLSKF